MKDFLESILGTYEPVSYSTFEYIDEQLMVIEVIPDGLAGVDWLYILSGIAFLICIYSVFRILGGLICKSL